MLVKLDRERLQGLLAAMAEQLRGDWLLVGGALVALWLEPRRVTEDIDLVGLGNSGEERLDLMRFADAMGLPIEAVNSAADYFVRRVPGWEDELELFHAGGQVRIYRPTATLFLLLKIARLSDQDLADCLALIDLARSENQILDADRVIAALDSLAATTDFAAVERRDRLRQLLLGWGSQMAAD